MTEMNLKRRKGGETVPSRHFPVVLVSPALNTSLKGEYPVAENENGAIKLELTEAQRTVLKSTGTWMMEIELDESEYSLKRMGQICDISQAWLRTCLQNGDVSADKNERGHWRVKREEVARIWQQQVEKLVGRQKAKEGGKKYPYRRPTQWAVHLIRKYVNKKGNVTATEKKHVLAVIERAEKYWNAEYERKKAEKEAKKAEKEAKKKKK